MKKDIEKEDDVIFLVNCFYDKVKADDLIGPIFNDLAKTDWDSHLPNMYDFWDGILLGNRQYKGRPFPKHIPLPLERIHFERWLLLFYRTLEENFEGPKSKEAMERALKIANNFMHKKGLL